MVAVLPILYPFLPGSVPGMLAPSPGITARKPAMVGPKTAPQPDCALQAGYVLIAVLQWVSIQLMVTLLIMMSFGLLCSGRN